MNLTALWMAQMSPPSTVVDPKVVFDNDVKQGFRHIQVYCNFYTLFLSCVVDHRLPFGYQLISTFKNMVEQINSA
jgi:hypothetical protein